MLAHSSPSVSADMPVASAGPLRRPAGVPTALTRAYGAGRHPGLGDRLGAALARTKGSGVPLLAVGPGPVPVRASGDRDTTDTAGLECRLVTRAGARSGAAPEGLGGGGPHSARGVVRASCCRVPFEAAGLRPCPLGVGVAAEAAGSVVLADAGACARSGAAVEGLRSGRALRVRIVVPGRHGRRSRRQGESDGEGADVVGGRRGAVVAGREARVECRVGRRAGRAFIGAAVALPVARADGADRKST